MDSLFTKNDQHLHSILFAKALINAVGRHLCLSVTTKFEVVSEFFSSTKARLWAKSLNKEGEVRPNIKQIVSALKNFEIGWRDAVIELNKEVSKFPTQNAIVPAAIPNIFETVVKYISVKLGTEAEENLALWEKKCTFISSRNLSNKILLHSLFLKI